jgi:HSP20 family protein
MTSLFKRNTPVSMTENFQNFIDRFFGDISFPSLGETDVNLPATDVSETEKSWCISTELPGMRKEDIKIAIQDGVLSIEAEMRSEIEEKDSRYLRRERKIGKFMRRFTVGPQVDESKIDAHFENGILTLTMPKTPAAIQAKPKEIPVH